MTLDPVVWNEWHVVADMEALTQRGIFTTRLLGKAILLTLEKDDISVTVEGGMPCLYEVRHGFVWVCLGVPDRSIMDIPELEVQDVHVVVGGAIGVHASPGRVIENFLDLGHLGYVHAGYLGAEPDTAVTNYTVAALPQGGIVASGCEVFQPNALMDRQGVSVGYTYKVEHPFIAFFDKVELEHRTNITAMYLFAQPVDEEHCIAHTLIILPNHDYPAAEVRAYQQLIFAQDKPILENQHPRRLPIGPRMEMPILADKTSVAYRRWIAELGITYGTLREAEGEAA